jgi:hypothetical protein
MHEVRNIICGNPANVATRRDKKKDFKHDSVSQITMSKHVIVQLLGGLGNQMFQYAAGSALAERLGRRVLIDTGLLRDHALGRHSVNRPFDLDLFSQECIEAPRLSRLRHNAHGLGLGWRSISRVLRVIAPLEIPSERFIAWKNFVKDENFSRPIYLEGLWQSWRYFAGYEQSIRNAFEFRQELPPGAHALVAQLNRDSAVAIHVRRGDYVSNPKDAATMGFVGLEYYSRAVEVACSSMAAPPHFFIFSDDLDWCRINFGWLPGPVSYVEQNGFVGRPIHHLDFQLLSQARRFILSNSTFAWWAAWLAEPPDKQVLAPKAWFRDTSIDSSDLCPPEWILL